MKQNSCREDKAKIMDNIEEPPDETRHHKRATQSRQRPNRAEEKVQRQQQRDSASGHTGNARPVHFALLPGPYEPLVEEDDAKTTSKQERKAKNKKKYKKYRKDQRQKST
ncbi:uncharacterized protein LOC136759289 isoform X2 [Amia ocellicauda]|uniref:uncharacterized protein LOC136759289 isoform X2 n=1 Tax=Amia ocellicauda TaxID=2972642 RepID=UPI003464461C